MKHGKITLVETGVDFTSLQNTNPGSPSMWENSSSIMLKMGFNNGS
jgi:hypothetical protein